MNAEAECTLRHGMATEQIIFLSILAGTLAMFMSERILIDVAAMVTLLALAFTGILTPAEALECFDAGHGRLATAVRAMAPVAGMPPKIGEARLAIP